MKKKRERINKLIFGACTIVSCAAAMLGINALPVMAAEDVGEEVVVDENMGAGDNAAGELSEDSRAGVSKSGNTSRDEDVGVYDFKDNKTAGIVTVTKEWSDKMTNSERPEPEIKISTKKPSKSTLGYTVTFHGNKDVGLVFDNGSDVNNVVYNSSGQIVEGMFKTPGGFAAGAVSWFADKALTNRIDVSEDGTVQMALNGDIELWGKTKTFEIKGYKYGVKNNNEFNALIPDTVTEIFFTDEIKPENASMINVDADGDGGVVAWTENDGTIMKVSTQIKGMKVQAAKNSSFMFCYCSNLTALNLTTLNTQNVTNMSFMLSGCSSLASLDLTPLDTSNVTYMNYMFGGCSSLTSLDLTSFNTANVTSMERMFSGCSGLTSLDLTSLNTTNVTNMNSMFFGCSGLTSLDLTSLNTENVTDMGSMFYGCKKLTSLDLTPLNTTKVSNTREMFYNCSGLTRLDLTPLNTTNIEDMSSMFFGCSGLSSLDLTPLNTAKVTNMSGMFCNCHSLTSLDLTKLDTTNVTDTGSMFYGCSKLTNLDLTPFNTANVTDMSYMFSGCSGLTSLDLTPLNTENMTDMDCMFRGCSNLTSLKTGITFKFVKTNYYLTGTWQNTAGETFTEGTFPSNVADTYTKISN